MAGLGDLLGKGSVVEQLVVWGLLNQALGAALAPALTQLQGDVQAGHPLVPLAPPDLADAVVRNYMSLADATAEAARSGLDARRFETLVPLHGDAPGPQQLAAALLRGLIAADGAGPGSTSFAQGIRESRLGDKWVDVIRGLAAAVLSPPDAASAVVRGFLTEAAGEAEAAKSGVSPALFGVLRALAGDAPGPQQLAEALRRGAIPEQGAGPGSTSFTQGIAEGRLADKWAPVIKALAKLWPTPVDALNAALKGQVTDAEGQRLYELLGGDLQFYTWLRDTEGEGPTPLQAADWARRGIIPWEGTGPQVTSYAQAVRESRFRDKWAAAYRASAQFVPNPREVVTLLKDGAATKEQAAVWLRQGGADDATVAAFIAEADATALSQYKGLTTTTVLGMFYERLISEADAGKILQSLHVSPQAVPLMLAYADLQRAIAQQKSAVSRIGSLYAARKITRETARQSLLTLKVPPAALDDIIATWQLENSVNVRLLTAAEIADAFELGIMTPAEALTELQNIGYTPYDAWVRLSIKAKKPLPGRPGQGPAPPQGAVVPGTT
jgi:hypothetical protein